MSDQFNRFLDWFSNFFAHRKGLLPLIGIFLVILNFLFGQLAPGWLAEFELASSPWNNYRDPGIYDRLGALNSAAAGFETGGCAV